MSIVEEAKAQRDRIAAEAIRMRHDIAERFTVMREQPPKPDGDRELREFAERESRRVRNTP
jgi:hypothetical protein